MTAAANEWATGHMDAIVAALQRFAAIPSVSTDPAYSDGMALGAAFLVQHMTECGLEHAAIRPTAGHPVVTADWLHAPGRPTILIYGHYDVQPPDPVEKWQTPPFEPTIRDNRMYARGVSDDKGPVMVALAALAALLQTGGALPVNVKLLIEGEEEMGSAHLEPFVEAHAAELAADFVLSADGAMWRVDLPTVTVAGRGLCSMQLNVQGAATDLHSGRHGGAVANPLQALAGLLASLHDRQGAVAVAGFYDDVRPPTSVERDDIAAIPFDPAGYLASLGASAGAGEAGWSVLERNWLRPTLELNGIWGGYAGPGTKTVIPAEAGAKLSCRLVPDQDPDAILDCIEAHLRRHCPPFVTLTLTRSEGRSRAFAVDRDHPGLRLATRVLGELYGQQAIPVRMGATIPIGGIFQRWLRLDTVFFSFSTVDESYHAPNEFFRLDRLRDGVRAWIRYLDLLGGEAA